MSHVALHVWRIPRTQIASALLRMGVDRLRLRNVAGLSFHKLLGTGHGSTFAVRDADVRTWALLTEWETYEHSLAFEAHPVVRGWRRIAEQEWRGDLTCLRSRGQWGGVQAFSADEDLSRSWTGPVAAITRARIRPGRWLQFWSAVPAVVADIDDPADGGPTVRLGIGEAPVGVQGTFTIWPDIAALRDFAYGRQPHRQVIAATPEVGWYAEDLFARFAVRGERGTLFGTDRTTAAAATSGAADA